MNELQTPTLPNFKSIKKKKLHQFLSIMVFSFMTITLFAQTPPCATTIVFINEFHYDNMGTDVGEFIEIAGSASTDLSSYDLVLYNGANGLVYNTLDLSGTIPNDGSGFGAVSFTYPTNGIQNGSPDGIALVDGMGTVVEFISYEGSFTAGDGPANGMMSTDVGISETSSTPVGQSLQRVGVGEAPGDFSWTGPVAASSGTLNPDQMINCPPDPPAGGDCAFEAYAINETTDEFVGIDPIDGSQTVISPIAAPTGEFLAGGEIVNGVYYVGGTTTGDIFAVDLTTGALTTAIAGCGSNITSLEVDPTTNILYGITTVCGAQTQLYQIDLAGGVCTPIGAPNTDVTCGISLIIDDAGQAYMIDIVGDDVTPIDLTTGASTGPGLPLGIDLNFGQDYDFDCPSGGLIYGFAFNNGTFSGQYVSIDPTTGTTTIITDLGFNQISSFAFCSNSCTTYASGNNISIPDNTPTGVDIPIVVSGSGTSIDDVNLSLDMTHTWVGDLVVTLTSPDGTSAVVFDRPGVPLSTFGCSNNNVSASFDDDATLSAMDLEDDCDGSDPAIAGNYQPLNPFSVFNGENPNGTWLLNVADNAGGDIGELVSAELEICTPPCTPMITCPAPATFECADATGIMDWLNAYTTESCGANLTVTTDYDPMDFPKCSTTTNTITFSLTDASGNVVATCTSDLTINEAPAPTPDPISFPETITCSEADVFTAPDLAYSNGLTGGCEISGTIPANIVNFFDVCGGTIEVSYNATDECGNIISVGPIVINVKAAPLPTINVPTLPSSLSCGDAPGFTPPSASFSNGLTGTCNLSGTASVLMNHFYDACGGTLEVIYLGEDACGRNLVKNVTIIDIDPAPAPTIDVPAFPNSLSCSDAASYVAPIVSYDNGFDGDCNISGLIEPAVSYNADACNGGTMTITYDGIDDCGNVLSATPVVIQVEPAPAPVLEAPKDVPPTIYCWDAVAGYYPGNATYSNGESGFCENSGEIVGVVTEFWNSCDGGYIVYDYSGVDDCGNELTPAVIKVSVLPDTWAPDGACAPYAETMTSIEDVPGPGELDYYFDQVAAGYYEMCGDVIVTVIDDTGEPQCSGDGFFERIYTVEIADDCGNVAGTCTITFSGSCNDSYCTMSQKFYGNPDEELNGMSSEQIIGMLIDNGANPIVIGDGTDCGLIIDETMCIQAMLNSYGEAISLPSGFSMDCFDVNNSLINQMVTTILNIRYNENLNPAGSLDFGDFALSAACMNIPGYMLAELPSNPTVSDMLNYANDFIACQCNGTCGNFQPNMADLTNLFLGLNSRFNNCHVPDPCGNDIIEPTFESQFAVTKTTTLKLYPNPANDFINLDVKDFVGLPGTLEIFDAKGVKVGEKVFAPIEQGTLEIEVDDFAGGLYWISINIEGHDLISRKFIVRK